MAFFVLFALWIFMDVLPNQPFSFKELATIPKFNLEQASYIKASDNINLAYYSFLSENPKAVIIFFHGGGLYSNRTYQYVGWQLQREYNIASYFVDIRGHGRSEGERGDASTEEQVFDDVNTLLAFVKSKFPETPLYLVGHSSGAALLLNYSAYGKRKDDLYKGYIFLAPYLGPFAGVEQPSAVPFTKKVRVWIYILNQGFKVPLFRHIPAVYFNYPDEIIKEDPLIVTEYTYTMSCATAPHDPKAYFASLNKPTFLYIGEQDEQFVPEKITEYARYNLNGMVKAEIISDAAHLSILLKAPACIASAIG